MEEQERGLPPELLLLLDAFRQEFDAKIGNLKAWGIAMCGVSSTVGGLLTAIIGPHATAAKTTEALAVVVRFLH